MNSAEKGQTTHITWMHSENWRQKTNAIESECSAHNLKKMGVKDLIAAITIVEQPKNEKL